MNLANCLTVLRIILTPFIVYFLFPNPWVKNPIYSILIASFGYVIASLSDYLDGYLARKYNWTSKFGEFLDPLADKILTLSVFTAIFFIPYFYMPKWALLFIVMIYLRESLITYIRIKAIKNQWVMKTERHGKIKTFIQITSQLCFLVILLQYAFVFQSDAFRPFITGKDLISSMDYVSLTIFQIYTEFYPPVLFKILTWLPLFLLAISAYYTVRSGVDYIQRNWDKLQSEV